MSGPSEVPHSLAGIVEDSIDRYLGEGMIHPSALHVLKFFRCEHLPEPLRSMSARHGQLALHIVLETRGPETTVALRSLLNAKDAAVRALLDSKGTAGKPIAGDGR